MNVNVNGELVYRERYTRDSYFWGFMYGLIYREYCYSCQYACPKRGTDITLGDFWGLSREPGKCDIPEYVSCVLVNTDRGKNLFEKAKSFCHYESREVDEAIKGNAQLRTAFVRPREKEKFNMFYKMGGFYSAAQHSIIKKKILYNKMRDILLIPYRIVRYGIHYKDLL